MPKNMQQLKGKVMTLKVWSLFLSSLVSHKNIAVIGYPKSGTTWLTRLLAEVIGCPVRGFWGEPLNQDPCIDGLHRKSRFVVYKGHQNYKPRFLPKRRIVYLVRDIRDVAISSKFYFSFFRDKSYAEILQHLHRGCINRASWCIPWAGHIHGYLDHNSFYSRYEDLLVDTNRELARILAYLKIDRSQEQIAAAVEKHSFQRVIKTETAKLSTILRKGTSRQYLSELSSEEKKLALELFGSTIKRLGYTD